MANKKRRTARGAYKRRKGRQAVAQRLDRDVVALERAAEHGGNVIEAVLDGRTADLDGALAAMKKITDETPDRVQLEERLFARRIARMELEERAARAFLTGVLSAVVRALVTVASGRDASDQDRFDAWDAARMLGEQLLTFCARRGIQPTEWPKEATFVSLLRDRDKAALIEELRRSGVMLGKQKLRLRQRDASAVLGVNEDYTSTVRHREKHPVKKTGRRRR